ncbi:DNA repair protein Rad4, partial [Nadsonia fulvescens var. elongata DSM 6958]
MDMKYVVAYENDGNTRNVTGRYLSSYVDKLTPPTRRQQRDTNSINSFMFFKRLMKLYTDSEKHTENLQREDEELARIMERTKRESNMENGRFSNKVAAYKNHEKFVLFSMIHKNEYLRPSAKPVHKFEVISRGKTRTETVFLLSDVQICRPKRVWLHEGRIIKAGQKPVKVERIKPRTLKRTREAKLYEIWANEDDSPHSQQQQGLFTYEQTELYQPPVIVDGVLPRNEYGNFECFKPHMLPLGTVKLRQKGMKSIAKKLGIDCVDLVVGFSFETGGQAHPVFDGVMVCKEYEAELVNTYNIEMEKVRQNQLKEKSDIALNRWRVYLVRLRLHIRLTKQYGSDGDDDKNMDHDVTEDNLANTNHY